MDPDKIQYTQALHGLPMYKELQYNKDQKCKFSNIQVYFF
jgi:hypothetical protein